VSRGRSIAIAIVVLVAVVGIVLVLNDGEDEDQRIARPDGTPSACMQSPAERPTAAGTAHPSKRFFEPDDEVEGLALAHVLGDGFVVVTYRRSLPDRVRERLRSWLESNELAVFAAPSATQREPVRAVTYERQIRCSTLDLGGLTSFRDTWLRELAQRR
jgi:hypothetical protein